MALTDPHLDAPTVPGPDLRGPPAETEPEVPAAIVAELHRQQTVDVIEQLAIHRQQKSQRP